MRIIYLEEDVDLRTINANQNCLKRIEKEYSLKNNGEAACFTNVAHTRFRLVVRLRGLLFLCIPQIDKDNNLSIYLVISETLAAMSKSPQRIALQKIKEETAERMRKIKEKRLRKIAAPPPNLPESATDQQESVTL
jgi:hypothetical protein